MYIKKCTRVYLKQDHLTIHITQRLNSNRNIHTLVKFSFYMDVSFTMLYIKNDNLIK